MKTLQGKTVAVTGATGFLGRYFVRELLAEGASVIAVVRNPERVPELRRSGITLRKADITNRDSLITAFIGADAVISNAAQVTVSSDFTAVLKQNLQGTVNTLHACAVAGVSRVVHISSASVYAGLRADVGLTEEAPLLTTETKRTKFNIYPISKACAEQEAWKLARELHLGLTTVRPYTIFGAFDQNSFSHYYNKLMQWPVAPYPVGLKLPLVYAGDIAKAVCMILVNDKTKGEAYNIAGEYVDFWKFYNAWAQAKGRHPFLRIPLPVPYQRQLDDNKLRKAIGWAPRPLIEGCRETIHIMKQQGHFPA